MMSTEKISKRLLKKGKTFSQWIHSYTKEIFYKRQMANDSISSIDWIPIGLIELLFLLYKFIC